MSHTPNPPSTPTRVVALDLHPDSFTAAFVSGPTPAQALLQRCFNAVPNDSLESWAKRHLHVSDVLVLEASGNSFHAARLLKGLGFQVHVLDSAHLGKLKDFHANNDRLSALRIAKAFLSGSAKTVWIPDSPEAQERRDWFNAHAKASRELTRLSNVLHSYLSDNGVRLRLKPRLIGIEAATKALRDARAWSPRQWQVLEIHLRDLFHAKDSLQRWESLLAQEVAADPLLLSLVRLVGVRDVVAFALGAVIGDVKRFADPSSLVNYTGLCPAFDQSGKGSWQGGVGHRGHRRLRALLVEAAHSILRSRHPMGQWGRQLMARRGERKLAVVALARKLVVAAWYLLNGRWEPLEAIPDDLELKLSKVASRVGPAGLQRLGIDRAQLRERMRQGLLHGRVYVVNDRCYPAGKAAPAREPVVAAAAPAR